MSYIGDALTFITGFLASPFVVSPSTGASDRVVVAKIIHLVDLDRFLLGSPPAAGPHEVPHGYQPSPSSGTGLPPPKDELCINTQLSLAPPKRSLHDSLRRAATEERRRPRADDAETKAQKLAAAKQEMLALAARR
ncbi:hypothetical protein PG990_006601 [Apiospora arundinis]